MGMLGLVPAKHEGRRLEPHAGVPDLPGAAAEPADQAAAAPGAGEAAAPDRACGPHQVRSLGFMHDQVSDGRTFWLFNVLDDFTREGRAFGGSTRMQKLAMAA